MKVERKQIVARIQVETARLAETGRLLKGTLSKVDLGKRKRGADAR
jgi:hypothetical protein